MKNEDYLYILLHHPRTGGESLTTFAEKHMASGETFRANNRKISDLTQEQKRKIRFVAGHVTYFGIHKFFPEKIPRYITLLRDPAIILASLYNSRMMDFPENKKQTFEKWYSLRKRNEITLFYDRLYRSHNHKIAKSNEIKQILRKNVLNRLDKTKTIHTFLKRLMKKRDSPLTEMKRLNNAKKLLDECWFVGITEHLLENLSTKDNLRSDMKLLFEKMGMNVNWKNYKKMSGIPKELSILNKNMVEKIHKENPLDFELYEYALKLNKEKRKKLENSRAKL